jgi:dTDP-4-dehydrorhamnose reductase
MADALIIRTSAFFGPWDRYNFLFAALSALRIGNTFAADAESIISPTYVPDLVHATLDLLLDGERGLVHLANQGAVTWAKFARMGAMACGDDPELIEARRVCDMTQPATLPRKSALQSRRCWIMPSLEDGVERFARECRLLPSAALEKVA